MLSETGILAGELTILVVHQGNYFAWGGAKPKTTIISRASTWFLKSINQRKALRPLKMDFVRLSKLIFTTNQPAVESFFLRSARCSLTSLKAWELKERSLNLTLHRGMAEA